MQPHAPVYRHEGITVYHGDCLDVLPTLAGESADFVLTDPPYLVGLEGRWDGDKKRVASDTDPAWLRPAFSQIWRVMKPDTFRVSSYGWPHADAFLGVWKSLGFRPVSHLALVKRQWGLGRFTRGTHETAFLLAKGRPPKPDRPISDVLDWRREGAAVHPNQKPVASLSPLLDSLCPPRGLVFDPFMGGGSTLRAAKNLSLRAVGIEIEARYCEAATRRMAQGVLWPRVRRVSPPPGTLFSDSDP